MLCLEISANYFLLDIRVSPGKDERFFLCGAFSLLVYNYLKNTVVEKSPAKRIALNNSLINEI